MKSTFCSNFYVQTLIWRKKSLYPVWKHSIEIMYGNSLSHFFVKNFVKATDLLNKLLKSWFDEIIFRWENISNFSTLWKIVILFFMWIGISLNQFTLWNLLAPKKNYMKCLKPAYSGVTRTFVLLGLSILLAILLGLIFNFT